MTAPGSATPKTGHITDFGPYPSQSALKTQEGGGLWGGAYQIRGFSLSAANDFLYNFVDTAPGGACGGTPFNIFDDKGELFLSKRAGNGFVCQAWVAVDNDPQSDSFGRYYLWENSERTVRLFDGYGNPVNFTASASYINGKRSPAPPKAPSQQRRRRLLPELSGITVDPNNVTSGSSTTAPTTASASSTSTTPAASSCRRSRPYPPTYPCTKPPWGAARRRFGAGPRPRWDRRRPTNGDVLVSDRAAAVIDEFSPQGKLVGQLDGSDTPAGQFGRSCVEIERTIFCRTDVAGLAVDSQGHLLRGRRRQRRRADLRPAAGRADDRRQTGHEPDTTSARRSTPLVDPNGGGDVTSCKVEYGTSAEFQTLQYKLAPVTCTPDPSGSHFSGPTESTPT